MEEKPSRKRQLELVRYDGVGGGEGEAAGVIYKFKILLPNGVIVILRLTDPKAEMCLTDFIHLVKREYSLVLRNLESSEKRRDLNWEAESLFLEDANGKITRKRIKFKDFKPYKCHILRLHDGSAQVVDTFENMWDLTPDTDLLRELPEEYTFETALADLIDNSLQAVWSIGENGRKLISVDIMKDRISIYDTGPGMDATEEENSIVKWGKMGASLHRSSKAQAIGVKPPYLLPFFGMFGYGGPIASMHLGRRAKVSSKTKESKKVYTLHLEREALLRRSGSESNWKTSGGMRDALEDEIGKSPQQSFTKVEIFEPKIRDLDIFRLQCKLKDIYFPYIQCDELSKTRRTTRPVEFQVNGLDLAEIEGGEVSITNLHSCNGPEFVFQLRFSLKQDASPTKNPGSRVSRKANARLKCVYFPISEGTENIEKILETLEAKGCEIGDTFESLSRVSIRRLGRLLPNAHWARLPFMEFKQKKGDRSHLLKRCCLRVKCFIETDAGFNPTPAKTDLAHQNPFTIALKNFGSKMLEKENEVNIEISRDGNLLSPSLLEKEYQNWILEMHSHYDKEINACEDDGILVIDPSNKNILGVSSDVVRVHNTLKRKGASWTSGQKIKILKGAGPGFHNKNVYVTLEYFLTEGLQGDAGGDVRIICRPLDVAQESGSVLLVEDGIAKFDIRSSLSIPISVIDSGKCQSIGNSEWDCQLQKQCQKAPSTIELLGAKHCQKLDVDGAFPVDATVQVGCIAPSKIVAVVRPANFCSSSHAESLDQRNIVKTNSEMSMEVKFRRSADDHQSIKHIYSASIAPSSRKGLNGLYIFSLGCKAPKFIKAGVYTFLFTLDDKNCKNCKKQVMVKACTEVGKWEFSSDKRRKPCGRVGSTFPSLRIKCCDIYGNQIPFASVPEINVKLDMGAGMLAVIDKFKADLSSDKFTLEVKDLLIESKKLDRIRSSYEATLVICPIDESVSVSIPCQVMPGSLKQITVQPPIHGRHLLPGCMVEELVLEMFDAYGNHVEEGLAVQLNVDGFHILDREGLKRKVDSKGCIDLSSVLQVIVGFGRTVSYSILYEDEIILKQELQTERRELRIASKVPEIFTSGKDLKNIVFEVVDSQGDVDKSIHNEEKAGKCHSLTIKSDSLSLEDSVQYIFRHGCCTIPAIRIPEIEGGFCFIATHSCYPELHLSVMRPVSIAPKVVSDEFQTSYSSRKALQLQNSLSLEHPEKPLVSITNNEKELVGGIERYGEQIGRFEEALKVLNDRKMAIEEEISPLQASTGCYLDDSNYLLTKEEVMKQIESSKHSAASIVCNLYRDFSSQEPDNNFVEGILGPVALLGTAGTSKLSRILAEYLGEDQMLALVCGPCEAASALEALEGNTEVDDRLVLDTQATAVGKPICGRFLVICLEDIRPYKGRVDCRNPERKLILPDPKLPRGKIPTGFVGYAVNVINLDAHHLNTRTAAGHGLRETLFYRLFGELQVYDTREHMNEARACIKHGAVSLDGGIIRVIENGIRSLGHWNPEICFPVVTLENEIQRTPELLEIQKRLETSKQELQVITDQIELVTRKHGKAAKKFRRRSGKLRNLLTSGSG